MIDNNFIIQVIIGTAIAIISLLSAGLVKWVLGSLLGLLSKKWSGFISTTVAILIVILGSYLITIFTSVDIKAFYAFIGLIAAGVTFGVTDFSGQLINSFRLLNTNIYNVGDYVIIDNYSGKVSRITTQYTILKSKENEEIVIPNKIIFDSVVINRNSNNKFLLSVSLPLQSMDIQQTIKDISYSLNNVVVDKQYFLSIGYIRLLEIGEDALIWDIGVWSDNSWFAKDNQSILLQKLVTSLTSMGYQVGYKQEIELIK